MKNFKEFIKFVESIEDDKERKQYIDTFGSTVYPTHVPTRR